MKYLTICLIVLINFLYPYSLKVFAEEEQTITKHYARIKNMGVYLYKTENQTIDSSNLMFMLENTYFVELLEDTNDIFYKAKYIDSVGYVKKSDVQCVKGTPLNPYANNISFRVFAQNGLNIRSTPEASKGIGNTIGTIPYLENNIQYYGKITGEEAVSYRGNTWYYCNYTKNGVSVSGYVYSGFCDLLSTISLNLEQLEEIDKPEWTVKASASVSEGSEKTNSTLLPGVSSTGQILIIIAVCIPGFIIIYLLFKPSFKNNNQETTETSKSKRNKKLDYYVFDDDEFN